MAVSVANTSIKLDVHSPKKDAIVAVPGTPALTRDIRIWAGGTVDPDKTQSIIGTFNVLKAYALSNLGQVTPTAPTSFHCIIGGGSADVEVNGSPTSDECRLEIGAAVVTEQQSHYIDRTVKRLIEAWLEVLQ